MLALEDVRAELAPGQPIHSLPASLATVYALDFYQDVDHVFVKLALAEVLLPGLGVSPLTSGRVDAPQERLLAPGLQLRPVPAVRANDPVPPEPAQPLALALYRFVEGPQRCLLPPRGQDGISPACQGERDPAAGLAVGRLAGGHRLADLFLLALIHF